MRYCTNCGHELGIGRYCTNCGARVPVPTAETPRNKDDFPTSVRPGEIPPLHPYGDDPLDTTPAPAAPAAPPPGPPPTAARYPLFADTVAAPQASAGPPAPPAIAPQAIAPAPFTPAPSSPPSAAPRRHRSVFPWVVGFLVLVLVALVVGIALMLRGTGEGDGTADDPARQQPAPSKQHTQKAAPPPSAEGGELVPADVTVPGTAPASVDSDGEQVTFVAGNMTDGDPRTCWRVAGDASGATITFTFDRPVTLTEVGLVNGYAKTDGGHDWYAGNRRVSEVTWVFDDGTEVAQSLGEGRSMQTTEVDGIETTSVELRLDGVTAPGTGADARDYTAISEVAFSGS